MGLWASDQDPVHLERQREYEQFVFLIISTNLTEFIISKCPDVNMSIKPQTRWSPRSVSIPAVSPTMIGTVAEDDPGAIAMINAGPEADRFSAILRDLRAPESELLATFLHLQ